jgi:hypothetical protein
MARATVAAVGWAVLLGALLVWEGIGLLRGGDSWPTLSDLIRTALRPRLGRALVFAVWLWVGWHLFVRGWRFFLRD